MLKEESQGLSCNILSKDLRLECSKDSVNTACCLVDQHKVCELHNDQALPPVCLPSVPLTSLYVTKFPRSSPSVFASDQKLKQPGNKARLALLHGLHYLQ